MSMSDNITYSGGQATEGQGGFYGSGGSRAHVDAGNNHRPGAVAHVEDIKALNRLMNEVSKIDSELMAMEGAVNVRQLELKGSLRKMLTQPATLELIERLEIKGAPVWGLTETERELVKTARDHLTKC